MSLTKATQYTLAPKKKFENNILLHQSDVGQVRKPNCDVPDIVFGKRSSMDKEGSKDVIFSWSEPCHTRNISKAASIEGKRKSSDQTRLLPSDKNPSFTYGISTKFAETASELMQNKFEEEWAKQKEEEVRNMKAQAKYKKEKLQSRTHSLKTRSASPDRSTSNSKKPINPFYMDTEKQLSSSFTEKRVDTFKLKQFQDVPARVDTRR